MVHILFGDEPQLIEEKKLQWLRPYNSYPIKTFTDESSPEAIQEALSQDSLFGDTQVIIIVNVPILKKANAKNTSQWDILGDDLMHYTGDNPVLYIFHDTIDKRLKRNKELLGVIEHDECKRLSGLELMQWLQQYSKEHGHAFNQDGLLYMEHIISLWQDVPVTFLRTELDRYFLMLPPKAPITSEFLQQYSSDYGAKNIFTFKEALLNKDVATLMTLFPYMLKPKEIDRAMSYIEGQLRLQLMVSQCRKQGMSLSQVQQYFKEKGSTIKSYPIKLAYEASRRISTAALIRLLEGLYDVTRTNRMSQGDMKRFQDVCLSYCAYTGEI